MDDGTYTERFIGSIAQQHLVCKFSETIIISADFLTIIAKRTDVFPDRAVKEAIKHDTIDDNEGEQQKCRHSSGLVAV